jgi:hypothetical protein
LSLPHVEKRGTVALTGEIHALFTNNWRLVFRLKMALVLLGLLNVAFFHSRVFRSVSHWDVGGIAPGGARVAAALSLLSWLAVISCGRLLAYT